MRIIVSVILIALAFGHSAFSDEPKLRVEVTTPNREQLLGEPLFVKVTLTNAGDKEAAAWVNGLNGQVGIPIVRDGDSPVRFSSPRVNEKNPEVERTTELLPPGKSKTCEYRILYTFVGKSALRDESRLAFEHPGTYTVKVIYPVPGPGERKIESNPVEIKVRKPEGVDAKVWREIKHRQFLYFLQHRELLFGLYDDTPSEIVEILRQYPKSHYCECLKAALRQYYGTQRAKMTTEKAFDDLEMVRVRGALGIVEVPPELWRGDHRLDVTVKHDTSDDTSVEKFCDEMVRQSGVPLRVAPQLRARNIIVQLRGAPLRNALRTVGKLVDGVWIEEKDGGYLLTVAPKN